MHIQYIHEFVVLSNCGNYMAAAEQLYLSQSSLSKHIMALEKELGVPLFCRNTRKVSLSQYGHAFLPYATQIVDADTKFREELNIIKTESSNMIQFGVLPSFLAYNVESVVLEFKKCSPDVPVFITEGSIDELLSNLRSGLCNIVMTRIFENDLPPEFETIPLLDDELVLVTTTESSFNDGRTSISLAELQGAGLLTSTSSMMTQIVNAIESQYNIRLNIISKISRASGIFDVLRKGIGDGALLHRLSAQYYQKQNPEKIQILEIDESFGTTVSLVYMKGYPFTHAMRSFINLSASHLARGKYITHGTA